ncbi:hypothetical protein Vqi01_51130 [Micromonospora qiuiae]|uniref:Uncharacterized protein n=1 Tax=Micromonospora qiuiae TaxID=502268 RepID=A0ABQ4JK94_9ACTN|nr:flavin reductase [Micromonospora qiuiae]GIJ29951.1 hypothetical protein Vqi01_51130 [Micromonospora qiuiae]
MRPRAITYRPARRGAARRAGAWPCWPAKLRLLADHQDNSPRLMVYLVTLCEEAAEQLAQHNGGMHQTDLHGRFTDWVPVRRRSPGARFRRSAAQRNF